MKLITVRDMILSLPQRWQGRKTKTLIGPKSEYERLTALDLTTASVEDVVAIVSRHWIELTCDECNEEADCVVVLSERQNEYGDITERHFCQQCLVTAQGLISGR